MTANRVKARREVMWVAIIMIMIGILLATNSVSKAIPIRQDPNMNVEGELVVGINNLSEVIKKLSMQLNDTTLMKYQKEILSNASSGNYTSVNELLNELKKYLRSTYSNKSLTEEETSEISLISSANNVNSNSVSLNMTEALHTYAELMKNEELLKTLHKLSEEGIHSLTPAESKTLLNALNKIISIVKKSPARLETFPSPPKRSISQEGINFSNLNELPKLPASLHISKVSAKQLYTAKSLMITLLALTAIAVAIYVTLKIKPEATKSLKKYVITTFTRLTTKAGSINDPIIKAYALTLKQLELYGLKKHPYETPREFLNRIKTKEFREILEELTPAYEVRAYSHRRLNEETINKILKLVREVIGPVRI